MESVPNPRPQNRWIVDEPKILTDLQRADLESRLNRLEGVSSVEFSVVILGTIDQASPKDFAVRLFNHWGVGKKPKDNGLLLLVVMDQRRMEFETGYGLEGVLPDARLSQVLHQHIVPQFKAGHPGAGIQNGVNAIVQILEKPKVLDEVTVSTSDSSRLGRLFEWGGALPFMAAGPVLVLGVLFRMLWLLLARRDPYWAYNRLSPYFVFLAGLGILLSTLPAMFLVQLPVYIVLGLAFFLIGLLAWGLHQARYFLRYRQRHCSDCDLPMFLLSEEREDEQLNKKQIFEENIQSRDYDVWVCKSCKTPRIDAYDGKMASRFSDCMKCGTKANKLISDVTVVPATTLSSGSGKITRECLACRHRMVKTYVIPQISTSSDSSSGSSDSGGSSFGGGSSGGGGAGASW